MCSCRRVVSLLRIPSRDRSCNLSVYVHRDFRRKGIGEALYSELINILRQLGYQSAFGAITEPNPSSVGLHEALGFRRVGISPKVGFKNGAWHDTCWYHLELGTYPATPTEPRSFLEFLKAQGQAQAQAQALAQTEAQGQPQTLIQGQPQALVAPGVGLAQVEGLAKSVDKDKGKEEKLSPRDGVKKATQSQSHSPPLPLKRSTLTHSLIPSTLSPSLSMHLPLGASMEMGMGTGREGEGEGVAHAAVEVVPLSFLPTLVLAEPAEAQAPSGAPGPLGAPRVPSTQAMTEAQSVAECLASLNAHTNTSVTL